jgi:hypothetical protein
VASAQSTRVPRRWVGALALAPYTWRPPAAVQGVKHRGASAAWRDARRSAQQSARSGRQRRCAHRTSAVAPIRAPGAGAGAAALTERAPRRPSERPERAPAPLRSQNERRGARRQQQRGGGAGAAAGAAGGGVLAVVVAAVALQVNRITHRPAVAALRGVGPEQLAGPGGAGARREGGRRRVGLGRCGGRRAAAWAVRLKRGPNGSGGGAVRPHAAPSPRSPRPHLQSRYTLGQMAKAERSLQEGMVEHSLAAVMRGRPRSSASPTWSR